MGEPSLYGALARASQLRSDSVAPNVAAMGERRHMAAAGDKPIATQGFGAFAVRQRPYAPGRISSVEPQALQQLLTAYLIHHGTHA